MSLDRIEISNLLLRCIVGINPEERVKKQDVLIHLTLYTDLRRAAASDAIEDVVDYKTVTKRIIDEVEASSFFLIEKLADHIASIIVCEFGVERVRVKLEKPEALRFAESVGVVIERTEKDFKDV